MKLPEDLISKLPEIRLNKAIAMKMAIALLVTIFAWALFIVYIPVYPGSGPVPLEVTKGLGLSTIASMLKERGLIRSETVFVAYVKLTGNASLLKAGKYNFSGTLNIPDVAFILVNGLSETEDIRLLVSEGFNIWEIDERLAKLNLIKEGEFSSKYYKDEGYLFPDTYRLNQILATNSYDLTVTLNKRMSDNYREKTFDVFNGLDKAEIERIIIVASILEKEARAEKDMKLVAGIIYKRMEVGMLLQVDATVVYGACLREFEKSGFKKNCDVTFQGPAREIKIDGPYNSYMRAGLPPGPISNPGLKAINAAMNPTKSDYLFYLSTRDGGQMIYSKTAGEHVANRRKYLGI